MEAFLALNPALEQGRPRLLAGLGAGGHGGAPGPTTEDSSETALSHSITPPPWARMVGAGAPVSAFHLLLAPSPATDLELSPWEKSPSCAGEESPARPSPTTPDSAFCHRKGGRISFMSGEDRRGNWGRHYGGPGYGLVERARESGVLSVSYSQVT